MVFHCVSMVLSDRGVCVCCLFGWCRCAVPGSGSCVGCECLLFSTSRSMESHVKPFCAVVSQVMVCEVVVFAVCANG